MYHETITEVILFCKIYIPVFHFITFVWYIFCSFQMCFNWAIFTLSWVYIKCQPLHRSHQPRTSLISLYSAYKTSDSLQICNANSYVYSYFECISIQNPAGMAFAWPVHATQLLPIHMDTSHRPQIDNIYEFSGRVSLPRQGIIHFLKKKYQTYFPEKEK